MVFMEDMQRLNTNNERYNLVSLGYFCAVAMELEDIGLRSCSLPFDWIISGDFASVLETIRNGFSEFLLKEALYQEKGINLSYYYNQKCKMHFYHDFVSWKSLDLQYDSFVEKYNRRIKRFYQMIQKPTVFIRYCRNEEEINFIRAHYEEIADYFRSFNPNNKIVYITNVAEAKNERDFIWVKKDQNSDVTNHFLSQLPDVKDQLIQLSGFSTKEIEQNILRHKRNEFWKFREKIARRVNAFFGREYTHNKQYTDIMQKHLK